MTNPDKSLPSVAKTFPSLDEDRYEALHPGAAWLIQLIENYKLALQADAGGEGFEDKLKAGMIELKAEHTEDVIGYAIIILLSELELFDTDEKFLAGVACALLHDTGRFPQTVKNGDFKDTKFDHGQKGMEMVKEALENEELELPFSDQIVMEILLVIQQHNKYAPIAPSLLLKLCRDADKVAILSDNDRLLTAGYIITAEEPNKISPELVEKILNKEAIDNTTIKTSADWIIQNIGFIFDLNFQKSKELIIEEGILDDLLDRLEIAIYITQLEDYENILNTIEEWRAEVLETKAEAMATQEMTSLAQDES